jgi:hypothetical protein
VSEVVELKRPAAGRLTVGDRVAIEEHLDGDQRSGYERWRRNHRRRSRGGSIANERSSGDVSRLCFSPKAERAEYREGSGSAYVRPSGVGVRPTGSGDQTRASEPACCFGLPALPDRW